MIDFTELDSTTFLPDLNAYNKNNACLAIHYIKKLVMEKRKLVAGDFKQLATEARNQLEGRISSYKMRPYLTAVNDLNIGG